MITRRDLKRKKILNVLCVFLLTTAANFTFIACGSFWIHYEFIEIIDIQRYDELAEKYDIYFEIFPEKINTINTSAENSFAFCTYEYDSWDVDVILRSKYDQEEEFNKDLSERTAYLKGKYSYIETIDQFKNGYTILYFGGLKEYDSDYIFASLRCRPDNSYYLGWTMLAYSEEEKTIIYNHAFVGSKNANEYGHIPYFSTIMDYSFKPEDSFELRG